MGPSRHELELAERRLRRYDKALRLRPSLEYRGIILLERKTFRGRIGADRNYEPDSGIRRELGHVPVASIPADDFNTNELLATLQATDSWHRDRPAWARAEEVDIRDREARARRRSDLIRYKTSELYDRFAWHTGARVSVPTQVR